MEPIHLEDRAILAVSGAEARPFLQGLVTNDLDRLKPGSGLYAALLSPQGKIAFDFLLAEGDGAILIDCARAARDALLKKLRLYRLRTQVTIEPRDPLNVYLGLKGHPDNRPASYAERAITFADPRHEGLGLRSIGAVAEMPRGLAGPATYHAARLTLGVPEADDFGFEKIFALDAGLEELRGVAFDKGCYVGQELTSRMKHRATARKRLFLVRAESPLPPIGTELSDGAQSLGEVVATYGNTGFALVRLDRLEPQPGRVTAGDISVALVRPAWLA
jgi:folate-binding protein YgfZ